jgi:hypothetical protein
MNMMTMTKAVRMMMWPGLNRNLEWYSSKYLTKPPMPEGMEIFLSSAIGKVRGWNKPPFVLQAVLAFN